MDSITIESLFLPSFSLSIIQLSISDTLYYPISSLSQILGYSSPQALLSLIDKNNLVPIEELYGSYLIDTQDSYSMQPVSFPFFKKNLKKCIPLFKSPYYFTNKEGVQQVLSRNTITCDKLKKEICDALNIPSIIHQPSKETSFYTALFSLLNNTNAVLKRQVYIAGYYADIEVQGLDKQVLIEYDENNHRYYNKENEIHREHVLSSLGYTILRVDDSLDPVSSASHIFKQLIKLGLVL